MNTFYGEISLLFDQFKGFSCPYTKRKAWEPTTVFREPPVGPECLKGTSLSRQAGNCPGIVYMDFLTHMHVHMYLHACTHTHTCIYVRESMPIIPMRMCALTHTH